MDNGRDILDELLEDLSDEKGISPIDDTAVSVIVEAKTTQEAKIRGARLLGLSVEDVTYQEIPGAKPEQGEVSLRVRVYRKGLSPDLWEEREDGSFFFLNLEDGLYLIVNPPKGKGKRVRLNQVLQEVDTLHYVGVQEELVQEAVKSCTSEPVKVGPRQREPELDGGVIVSVLDDGRKAAVTLTPPKEGGVAAGFQDVLDALKKEGVVVGIKEDVIRRAVGDQRFNEPIIVAECIQPTRGKGASFEYQYRSEGGERVVPGQLLAVKTRPSPGKPGKKVTGEEIPALLGQDFRIIPGRNVRVSSDGLRAFATEYGEVHWFGHRVSVDDVYRVPGDLTQRFGNVEFSGRVVIEGSVRDDVVVRASGDVEVMGSVEDATIDSGGYVFVCQGITGKKGADISAHGDIVSHFAQGARLKARQDIVVSELLMNCNCIAGRRVICQGKKGIICGGRVFAGEEVDAKVIGSPKRTPTEVRVDVLPGIQDQASKLRHEKAKCEERLDYEKDVKKREQIERELQRCEKKLSEIHEYLSRRHSGRISIQDVIYPETKVIIGTSGVEITSQLRNVSFILGSDRKIEHIGYKERRGR